MLHVMTLTTWFHENDDWDCITEFLIIDDNDPEPNKIVKISSANYGAYKNLCSSFEKFIWYSVELCVCRGVLEAKNTDIEKFERLVPEKIRRVITDRWPIK